MKRVLIIQGFFLACAFLSVSTALFMMVTNPPQVTVATLLSLSIAFSFIGTYIHEIVSEFLNRMGL